MAGINWTRVLLGGVLAAVILMAGGWLVDGVLLLERWNAQAASMGKQMDMSGAGMVAVLVWAFGLGIIMTWLYAAIRAQYGPGVGTALKAVLAVWLCAVAIPNLFMWGTNLFGPRLLAATSAGALVSMILAGIAGAWVYRPKEEVGLVPGVSA
jgi:hypothetical protein